MERELPMNPMEEYFVNEFVAEYKAGRMSRRDMMKRILYITGGVASAASLLSLMGCSASSAPASPSSGQSSAASSSAVSSSAAAASAPAGASSRAAGGSAAASPASSAAPQAAAPSSSGPSASGTGRSPLSVAPDDAGIEAKSVSFQGNGTTLLAYQALPKGAPSGLPLMLVVHRNLGLEPQILDVARRWAKAGYAAVALDLLSRQGGTDKVDKAKIPALLSQAPAGQAVADFKAAADYFSKQPFANPSKIGINGFCYGGGIVWQAAEGIDTLKAAVPFYGPPPPLDAVKNIKAAVFGVYSSDPQDFANNKRDQLEAALKDAGVTYQMKIYPGTHHDFYNDTSSAYNEQQALAAWSDTQAWMTKYLKS